MENINFDFFSEEFDEKEIVKMNISDYVSKTKKILSDIHEEYSSCWFKTEVSSLDVEKCCDCDNCKGSCIIVKDDNEFECITDYEEGMCCIREFDNERFSQFMEDVMFNDDSNFYELLESDVE